MHKEIPALKFKFDADGLPGVGSDEALGLTVGELALQRIDIKTKIARHGSEEEYNACFIRRSAPEPAELDGRPQMGRPISRAGRRASLLGFVTRACTGLRPGRGFAHAPFGGNSAITSPHSFESPAKARNASGILPHPPKRRMIVVAA